MARVRSSGAIRATVAFAAALVCGRAAARDIWEDEDGERTVALTTTIKATTVIPESDEATNLWRLRFGFAADAPSSHAEIAYEHRTRSSPSGTGVVIGLPLDAPAPFRSSARPRPSTARSRRTATIAAARRRNCG